MFVSKKKSRRETIRCPSKLKPNVEYLVVFISGEMPLISAEMKISGVGAGESGDRIVVQKSLGKRSRNSHTVDVSSSKKRNWLVRTKNVPGFTISFTSQNRSCWKGFHLTVTMLSSVSYCSHPKSIPNGRISFFNFGRTIRFVCCKGFKPIGIKEASCVNSLWYPSSTPVCKKVDFCKPPQNMKAVGKSPFIPLGSTRQLSCDHGYKLDNLLDSLPSSCDCHGNLNISSNPMVCQRYHCGPPPPPPSSGSRLEDGQLHGGLYIVGSVVNYTCPVGYGLDGVPFRVCTERLRWEPSTAIHTCRAGYKVCPDPGIPQNGFRLAPSFGHGHMASFGCQSGFELKGSYIRICDASDPNKSSWSGVPVTCKSIFKSPEALAIQLRESFFDRTLACTDNPALPNVPSSTPAFNQSDIAANLHHPGNCRGRAVVVGEGCVDLIFIVDCSRSVGLENFRQSLKFVTAASSLFDIARGSARVTLITYDHNVYQHFRLGDIKTFSALVTAISRAKFCGGATATSKVLKFVVQRVVPNTRPKCKKAIFLFTDGQNNWAGDPENEADYLREEVKNVEIYTIAFGERINRPILESLASSVTDHFFHVRILEDFNRALDKAFTIDIDYCQDCGKRVSPSTACSKAATGACDMYRGAWPWMAAIYRTTDGCPKFHCGGSVIGDCWILTAAHCVKYRKKEELIVVLGEHEKHHIDGNEKGVPVEKIVIHDKFELGADFNRDVALLKLPCSITCSPFIRKACLPNVADRSYYEPSTRCIATGWGYSADKSQKIASASLKELHLPIADHKTCKESTSPRYRSDVTEYTVCAGDGTGRNDTCQGDSGGPLFCKRRGRDQYVIVGIVSWGEGCGEPKKYGVYAHLLKLVDWVHHEMRRHHCGAPGGKENSSCFKSLHHFFKDCT
jgi:uncharacterized protein YegL